MGRSQRVCALWRGSRIGCVTQIVPQHKHITFGVCPAATCARECPLVSIRKQSGQKLCLILSCADDASLTERGLAGGAIKRISGRRLRHVVRQGAVSGWSGHRRGFFRTLLRRQHAQAGSWFAACELTGANHRAQRCEVRDDGRAQESVRSFSARRGASRHRCGVVVD